MSAVVRRELVIRDRQPGRFRHWGAWQDRSPSWRGLRHVLGILEAVFGVRCVQSNDGSCVHASMRSLGPTVRLLMCVHDTCVIQVQTLDQAESGMYDVDTLLAQVKGTWCCMLGMVFCDRVRRSMPGSWGLEPSLRSRQKQMPQPLTSISSGCTASVSTLINAIIGHRPSFGVRGRVLRVARRHQVVL